METATRKPRTAKPQQPHIAALKQAVSVALKRTWEFETAKERFEKAKHKHEMQLAVRKLGVENALNAVAEAAAAAKGHYSA